MTSASFSFRKSSIFFSKVSLFAVLSASIAACSSTSISSVDNDDIVHPSDIIDLSYWNITLPTDVNADGKPDMVKTKDIQAYTHPDFFYVNNNNEVVFTSPNVAVTTANSKNARSELRHMSRGINTRIKTKDPKNNFVLAAHPKANEFAAIGGKLEATLKVNHVALNSSKPEKFPSYSVVIGQIHAGNDKDRSQGFGYGNEPLKIYFKKFPNHEFGSVFWTYERNLPKEDPNRTDIAYPVWGNTWENTAEPGKAGVALNEEFSYEVNVVDNIMHLSFTSATKPTVNYSINLADNVNAYGEVDAKDFAQGYAGDWHYFKAGAYNQCNGGTANPFWGTGCSGTGVWELDYKNGDYTQVTFSNIKLSSSQ